MKKVLLLLVMAILFAGCEYDAPISGPQGLDIDSSLTGLWIDSSAKESDEDPSSLLILEFSQKDYLIAFSAEGETMYFKGYPVELAGDKYVQVQLIGSDKMSAQKKDRKFHLVSYEAAGNRLELSLLNSDVVDSDLTDSKKLHKLFMENKDNDNLFREVSTFVKASAE
jgi:hypothetical protein